MAFVDIDLSREGFASVPNGMYTLRIVKGTVDRVKEGSPNAGLPIIKWEFEIVAPDKVEDSLSGDTIATKGQHVFRHTPAWQGAGGFLKNLAQAAGVDTTHFDTDKFIGKEVRASITNEIYQGETQARVGKFFKA